MEPIHAPNTQILITNLREAERLNQQFDSVLTVGPGPSEVRHWGHPDHKVVRFSDTLTLANGGATQEQVAEVIEWAKSRKENRILIHCHQGMSRSTSMAVAILASWGTPEDEALAIAKASRPKTPRSEFTEWGDRPFIPNPLVLHHVDALLNTDFVSRDPRHERMLKTGFFSSSWGN